MDAIQPANRTIIVMLSRDYSSFSWLTYFTDGGKLTHASIAFDEDADYYYSFNFKGFKREYKTSLKRRQRQMKRYKISVTEEQYQKLKELITDMEAHREKFSYAKLGATLCLFKIPNPLEDEDKYFCSEFVATVLDESGCVHITKARGNTTPNDIEKAIVESGKLTGIEDDSTMKPLSEMATGPLLDKLEEREQIMVNLNAERIKQAQEGEISPLELSIGYGKAEASRIVYRSAATLTKKAGALADFLPAKLAEKTGALLNMSSERLTELQDRLTKKER